MTEGLEERDSSRFREVPRSSTPLDLAWPSPHRGTERWALSSDIYLCILQLQEGVAFLFSPRSECSVTADACQVFILGDRSHQAWPDLWQVKWGVARRPVTHHFSGVPFSLRTHPLHLGLSYQCIFFNKFSLIFPLSVLVWQTLEALWMALLSNKSDKIIVVVLPFPPDMPWHFGVDIAC